MSGAPGGPLPAWDIVGSEYEAVTGDGVVWRLWEVTRPADDDPHPAGYRLAPRDDLTDPMFITGKSGLYHALDLAGVRIASPEVQADPAGARRQLGLDD
ncbi:hypothetical protein [Streptomyces sp. NPDC057002]|uniref:hypothetical protein n=1 Tax=Streptomyces sp. NPDC057002 TaxID=3345992 RepID=UPI00362AEF80